MSLRGGGGTHLGFSLLSQSQRKPHEVNEYSGESIGFLCKTEKKTGGKYADETYEE
jgi:hypothetical protein